MKFTKEEIDFIESSLNETWNAAHKELERKDLGDIEKEQLIKRRDKAKELMLEIYNY